MKKKLSEKDIKQVLQILQDTYPDAKPELKYSSAFELLISTRNKLRNAKQWQMADEIRAELNNLGINIEDGSQGTTWK